ncbi:1-deoxy-D-xylulose-5-phosphate reductoisomerase [Corynebacterium sp. 320]|uniref:1-deoxy-D-xylulose 5-phosphate reductoisomerase n=1 Tax=Corynebacterium zhongnanshanii TaxID=2768834 RepID=A0ABQ6VG03_9CORY|nr:MULTISPECIES: 1-deoxy-D-xylulose-5-phosphate reductoisomerase [Corynebacterium]KAB1503809.1 1-deoxy-D-xylulose-5-phosphate reductoisomerase [Corynebacterium sp. 320]KAB1553091.1 1-deoxy-D-xylulose-5-phosphate reductoisomerase [Corynebacterium sp. 321]KAB1553691.1 1-deoxy-D-xylulose-5-phosphate reductoisomerase [Corynebacterium sp. 319]KAB3523339.1 1-deoxy-D-xylulose-5-phosphate reductoisomerase [Corynebacterium zhongnanshanii]KAB3527945.1 1-deoxy-D-xylulose-5-phosphate reductoisomerase [Cor
MNKTRVVVLGSTGSIGTQALEVIAHNADRFELVGIAAQGSQPELLVEQARQFGLAADHVAVASERSADIIDAELDGHVIRGVDSARQLVESCAETLTDNDVILNALVGSLGLDATLATLATRAKLALANKESLVAGGHLVLDAADPGQLVPVDSEHSAMAQCLLAGRADEVDTLVLTASGGPFRGWTREQLEPVTPLQAAQHPTWSMGQMNTLNSASLVNKGLELIEASLLFGIPAERIEVTVHPQSIVHSMVTFCDGATIAQASPPSMKLPISLALGWPDRVPDAQPKLDFRQAATWEFEPLDDEVFPAVRVAREAVTAGGTMPAVYNAVNEEAAVEFLNGRLSFPRIVDTIEVVMSDLTHLAAQPRDLEDVLAAEREARTKAHERMQPWLLD